MSVLDAGFLEAEDSDPRVSLAVGGLAVIDGPIPDDDELLTGLTRRLMLVPRFKQILHTHPLDLGAPEWVDDVALDLSHHIRRAAVPHPFDDRALFRLAAAVMESRLDRNRPLWECWIIEGLADGRWALLMKVHHCIADGIAMMRLFAELSDGNGGDTYATEIRAANEPLSTDMRLPGDALWPVRWGRVVRQTSHAVSRAAMLALRGAAEITVALLGPAAPSPLTGPLTDMRRYSAVQVPLADVRAICRRFDVTLNDVALTAITGGFRELLLRRGVKPRRDALRTLVPVSIRSNSAASVIDNRISLMLPYLPVDESDPREQLKEVHRRLTRAKQSGQRQAGSIFISAVNVMPFPLTAWAVRTMLRLSQRGVVTLATNVPGPRHRLRVMGREVVRLLPIPPIALQIRVVIVILTYADDLVFGITGDFDGAPDVDELARAIERTVTSLAAAGPRRKQASRKQRVGAKSRQPNREGICR